MKPIQLTQKHKDKLLEMCQVLFPEYDFSMFHNGHNSDLDINHLNNTHYLSIHWFEFCMTHLAEKLSQYPNQIEVDHPVDYLFEEFKKLNL
jgi:hypothetical protein